jgi:hypothetical protein
MTGAPQLPKMLGALREVMGLPCAFQAERKRHEATAMKNQEKRALICGRGGSVFVEGMAEAVDVLRRELASTPRVAVKNGTVEESV